MKIQVNSDKTIPMGARLAAWIETDANRLLDRFGSRLTRVEIHLSDIDNKKSGRPDKRCLVEVRPSGSKPLTATALATTTESAVTSALGKMQRSLTTFYGRKGRAATNVSAPVRPSKASPATKSPAPAKKKATAKKAATRKIAATKAAATKPAKAPSTLSPRGPKKKAIFQARRKNQPSR